MIEADDILHKINEAGGFEHFLASRKQMIENLISNNDTIALENLLLEDTANLAGLKLALKKTGEHISNIKMIEQYNI